MRAAPPRAPKLDPACGAEVPGLGAQASQWEQILWFGTTRKNELLCEVYPVTGAKGQSWWWIHEGIVVHVGGRQDLVERANWWVREKAERRLWQTTYEALFAAGRGVGNGTKHNRTIRARRPGLRHVVWSAAHRVAFHCFDPDPDPGSPGIYQGKRDPEAVSLRCYIAPEHHSWWSRDDLVDPGACQRAKDYRASALSWVTMLYAHPPPWQWWLDQFVVRSYRGAEAPRQIGGKGRSASKVVAELLMAHWRPE